MDAIKVEIPKDMAFQLCVSGAPGYRGCGHVNARFDSQMNKTTSMQNCEQEDDVTIVTPERSSNS